MNGLEALEQLRAEEALTGKHTPVFALTADALKGTEEKLLKTGFDGYLAKPVKIIDLTNELARVTPRLTGRTLAHPLLLISSRVTIRSWSFWSMLNAATRYWNHAQ